MHIGTAVVERFVEWVGPISTVDALFPGLPSDAWEAHLPSLAPTFWYPATRAYRAAIQTWVVRVDGLTVVVDTGVGDGRDRPQVPEFADLRTGFDRALLAGGLHVEDVDVVVNTHIHYDHVGWNTRRQGAAWVPTFPNARYLVPRADVDAYRPGAGTLRAPRTDDERRRFEGSRLVFEDSIQPVEDAGLLETWAEEHVISPSLTLEAAPGHTAGSSVLRLDAGETAYFVGDLLHTPLQVEAPDAACAFDLDADAAAASRRRVLADAAAADAYLLPAHLAGPGAVRVRADDTGFTITGWAPLPEV